MAKHQDERAGDHAVTLAAMYIGALLTAGMSITSIIDWFFDIARFVSLVIHWMLTTLFDAIGARHLIEKH